MLAASTPIKGYYSHEMGASVTEVRIVNTLGEFLAGAALGCRIHRWSDMRDGTHELPFAQGAQAAWAAVRIQRGRLVSFDTAVGEEADWRQPFEPYSVVKTRRGASWAAEARIAEAVKLAGKPAPPNAIDVRIIRRAGYADQVGVGL